MTRHASAVLIAMVLNATPLFGQSAVAQNSELIVKAAPADVHKYPTVASGVIGKAPAGTALEIRRNLGSWVEVPWQGSETGIAFVHVNAGTIVARSTATAAGGAQEAVAHIDAVAAAANVNPGARSGMAAGTTRNASTRDTYVLPPHHIGMGAAINPSTPAFAATVRTWWDNRLGIQFNMSRPRLESVDGESITATQFAPSVLYSLPDGVTNSMWLRPYVGAGPRIYHANLETGLGYEAFGGAEATLAAMPQVSVSADVGYRWSRPSINGFEPRQVGFSLSGHWYLK